MSKLKALDADVESALKNLGFETVLATDLDRSGMNGAVERFSRLVQGASVALVSKVYPMRSHTVAAEGGAAAVVRTDTINAMTGQPMTDSLV